MSAEVDKIENVDIYSFKTLESLKKFVCKQKFVEYESSIVGGSKQAMTPPVSNEPQQCRYNTRRSKMKQVTRRPAATTTSENSSSPRSSSSYEEKLALGI